MLRLTPEETRRRIISEAVIKYMKEDPEWFKDVSRRVRRGIMSNPGKREQVILKWVKSCEMVGAPETKEEILAVYDQRNDTQIDPQEVRDDQ